jgi:uncharacterized protein YndB with AHSA1/START domain
MSILTMIVLTLLVILILLFISASFLSDQYSIEASIVINRPVEKVFDFIRYLRHADRYNKWTMVDRNLKRSFLGTDGKVGFVSSWDSEMNQVGKGEQEIIAVQEGSRVDYEIRFEKPFQNISYAYISTVGLSDSRTEVQWVFKGKRNLFMKLFHLVFNLQKSLAKDLSESLSNLKRIMES